MRRDTIGKVEEQLQSFLCPLRICEVNRVVGGQRNLVGYQTEEPNLFRSVRPRLNAGNDQAAQPAMRGGQRDSAKGSQPSFPHHIGLNWKTGIRLPAVEYHGLLCPI